MMQFTDSHCHLDDKAFKAQLPALLAQCAKLAINRIIIPATSPSNFNNILALAAQHHNKPIKLYPCLGIHPWFLTGLNDTHLEQLTTKVIQEKDNIVAVGEIGIDGANIKRSNDPVKELAAQQNFFDYQLNLAKQQSLPVVIHHRQSHDKIMPFIKRYKLNKAGIIHGFSGSYQQATDYLDLGFKLGVGSTITYSRAKKTINTLKRLPLQSLVLETDAPSMPLSKEILISNVAEKQNDYTLVDNTSIGKQIPPPANSPINIVKIFEILSTIRSENPEEIASQLELNIAQVFFS